MFCCRFVTRRSGGTFGQNLRFIRRRFHKREPIEVDAVYINSVAAGSSGPLSITIAAEAASSQKQIILESDPIQYSVMWPALKVSLCAFLQKQNSVWYTKLDLEDSQLVRIFLKRQILSECICVFAVDCVSFAELQAISILTTSCRVTL